MTAKESKSSSNNLEIMSLETTVSLDAVVSQSCAKSDCPFDSEDSPTYACSHYTLSGRIGKVVATHAEGCNVAISNPGCG